VHISSVRNPGSLLGNIILLAVAVLFLQAAAAGQACGGDQAGKVSDAHPALPEEIRERYGWLYHPVFARVELARMLPELNDPPDKLRAPFRVNADITFRLLIKNVSTEAKSFTHDSTYRYNRPDLYKDGGLLPYRKDVLDKIKATNNPASDYSRIEQLKPGEEFTEIIKLADWYQPLQPGRYELKVCHRFIWGGEWLETPALTFEVVR
jgi:hypothetical protein